MLSKNTLIFHDDDIYFMILRYFLFLLHVTCFFSIKNDSKSIVLEDNDDKVTITSQHSRHLQQYEKEWYYIYELEEEFWWRWPNPGSDCDSQGYLSHSHAEFSGMGPPILPDSGLFLTWHFSLFSSLYNRLKRSRRRTYDPEKASLFIIPYDLSLDGYADKRTCKNKRSCTFHLAPRIVKRMEESKYFQRYEGVDHVVLWSLGQYHPWPHNGCDTFMMKTCAKCTMTCYWMDSTKPDSRFISVPFPSGYHWWDGIKDIPWAVNSTKRNFTAVYLGSTQTLNPAHTKIRRAMTAQCTKSPDCHWMQIGHSSIDSNIADFLSVYRKSIFCLCPPGDDPARKALFDAILSGCIPVVFQVATLYNQYWWHIGEEAALDITIYLPGEQIRSGTLDMMKVLLNISSDIIRKKQEAIARIAPRVQYAMPPMKYLQDIRDVTPWDPPFPDGVDILLDGLFKRLNRLKNNQSGGIPPKLLSGREWGQQYEKVRIQVPDKILSQKIINVIPKPCAVDDEKCLVLPSKTLSQKPKPTVTVESNPKSKSQVPIQLSSSSSSSSILPTSSSKLWNTSVIDVHKKSTMTAAMREIAEAKLTGIMNKTWPILSNIKPKDNLFYIYELEEEFWWRWPDPGSDCDSQGYLSHSHAEFSGMGPPILPDSGLFLTWHFSLFSSLYNRLKRSRRRTYDPEKASLFIIPYDLSLDGFVDKRTCRSHKRCTHGLAPKLSKYLLHSPYFQRYEGIDHVVLWSLGQYNPWPYNGCDVFIGDICKKCAITCYWMDAKKPDSRFISVPFPSGYHWWDGIKDIPWAVNSTKRNLTVVYLGSTQTLNPTHTKIRRAMTQQCLASPKCHWVQLGHSSTDNNIATLLTVYRRAIFCLCPPGDDPARKALFDAILSGCIPVTFELNTLINQYPWHIGEETALDISVHIPGSAMRAGNVDFMKILLSIRTDIIHKKQEKIAEIAPKVQYSIPPLDNLLSIHNTTLWDPPFQDGVDVMLNGLFERSRRIQRNMSSGIPPRVLSGREWARLYDMVKVKVPGEKMSDRPYVMDGSVGNLSSSSGSFTNSKDEYSGIVNGNSNNNNRASHRVRHGNGTNHGGRHNKNLKRTHHLQD